MALFGAIPAACGSGEEQPVEPLPRSTLSTAVPTVDQLDHIDALPKPADFGPGWTFETDSIGKDDYFFGFANGVYARNCRHADPSLVKLSTNASSYVVTGQYMPSGGSSGTEVTVAVDAPAKQADRIAVIRRAYGKCEELRVDRKGGGEIVRRTAVAAAEPMPLAAVDTLYRMTGNTTLDIAVLAAAQLLILSIAWVAPHIVYIGHVDPGRYGEQATTVLRARVFLVLPATVALCWWGARWWLDTRHDVAIVLYIALCCRLVMFAARYMRAASGDLSWFFVWVIGPLAAFTAILTVTGRIVDSDPSAWAWIFGGIAAVFAPPCLVTAAGWLASSRIRERANERW
jgi:hypothetical protein